MFGAGSLLRKLWRSARVRELFYGMQEERGVKQ